MGQKYNTVIANHPRHIHLSQPMSVFTTNHVTIPKSLLYSSTVEDVPTSLQSMVDAPDHSSSTGGRIGRSAVESSSSSSSALLSLGSTTEHLDHYDIVRVDLDFDRDYPIYIGTEYSIEEGTKRKRDGRNERTIFHFK
jgi:hypothetical protein